MTTAANAQQAASSPTLVTAAHLLDVRSGKLLDDAQLLIRDGRIERIAHGRQTLEVAAGTARIDLGEMTIVPGLIDMHVHLDSDPSFGGYTGLEFSDRFW